MDGWTMLLWGAVCAGGMLSFARLVANEVERGAQELKRVELIAQRALARHAEIGDEEVVTVDAA